MDMANFKLIVRTFASCFGQVTIWEAMEDDFVMIGCTGDFPPDFSLMRDKITARLLQIDKENCEYQGMFFDITHAIEQEKGSIFYPPCAAGQK